MTYILFKLWLPSFTDLFPFVPILLFYKRFDYVLKVLSAFLIVSALSDVFLVVVLAFQPRHHTNNSPVFHIYYFTCINLCGMMYYRMLINPLVKKAVLLLTVFSLLLAIVNVVFVEKVWEYPSITNTALSLMFIIFSLLYFYQVFNNQQFVYIEKQGLFWVNVSILFYYSVTVFLFMLLKRLSVAQVGQYYVINTVANVISNALFTIGLFCKPEKASLSN